MRSLFRPPAQVPTLEDAGVAGRKRLAHIQAYQSSGALPGRFEDHWNSADVRGFLHAMQGDVCAYCNLQSRAMDVEHFRPKGAIEDDKASPGYWWLAYDLSNYFLACGACNGKRKGTRFPIGVGAERATFATRERLSDERAILLDPVADSPVEEWFHMNWGDVTAELHPAPGLSAPDRSRIQDVIRFFNLNGDYTVRSRRSLAFETAVRSASREDWEEVRRLAMRHREHSFAARFVLHHSGKTMPSEQDEAAALASETWKALRNLIVEARPPRAQDTRQKESYAWALRALLTGAGRERIELFLVQSLSVEPDSEVRSEIVRLFDAIRH